MILAGRPGSPLTWSKGGLGTPQFWNHVSPRCWGSDPRAACESPHQVCRTRCWRHGARGSWGPDSWTCGGRARAEARDPGNEQLPPPTPTPAQPSSPLAQLATKVKSCWLLSRRRPAACSPWGPRALGVGGRKGRLGREEARSPPALPAGPGGVLAARGGRGGAGPPTAPSLRCAAPGATWTWWMLLGLVGFVAWIVTSFFVFFVL